MGKTKIEIGDDGRLTAPASFIIDGKRPYLAFTDNLDIPVKFPQGKYVLTINKKALIVAAGMDPRLAVVNGPLPRNTDTDLVCYQTPFGKI